VKQSTLAKWLKVIALLVAVMGAVIFFVVMPVLGRQVLIFDGKNDFMFMPILIFVWMMAVPFYIADARFFMIGVEIGRDNSFSAVNIRSLDIIGRMAIFDVIALFAGGVALYFMGMLNAAALLISLFVCIVGLTVSIICAALGHLVQKAIDLKEENDLTI